MRIFRLQRTLWRVTIIALLDIAALSMAALVHGTGAGGNGGSAGAYLIQTKGSVDQGLPVTITIEPDATIYVDGIPSTAEDLEGDLKSALSINASGRILIESAPGVPFATVSATLGQARTAGAKSLSLITEAPGGNS